MRICILSYIGNEDDIVETFVRHGLRYADEMIVVSTTQGQTRDTLLRLQSEGLPLTVLRHAPAFHDQHEILTRLLRRHKDHADWFLLLDADEFVTGDIRAALGQSQPELRSLAWKTYVPMEGDDVTERDVLKRIRHHRSSEVPQFSKIVIPSSCIRWDAYIGRGNHSLSSFSPPFRWTWYCGKRLDGVAIAHFPVRGTEQMERKIAQSWPAVKRNPRRKSDEASHWASMHRQYAGASLTQKDLTHIALHYSSSPEAPAPSVIEDPVI